VNREIDRNDRELLVDAVRQAGELAKTHYDLNESEIWNKSNNSPVTDADIAVNTFLLTELMKARPNYGWLSEETKDDGSRREKSRVFVVDPIGGGACLNGRPIRVTDSPDISGIRMIGYDFKFKALKVWPPMTFEARNSMAYRIALVASGQAHATVAFTPKCDWDLAAASLIATEAGAVITDRDGEPFLFDQDGVVKSGVICAGTQLHPLLLDKVIKGAADKTPASPRD